MAAKIIRRIPRVASEYSERDLVWSLRPIFLAMRIFGTDLDVIRRRTVYRRCAFLVLAVFILICISYIQFNIGSYRDHIFQVYQNQGIVDQFLKGLDTIEGAIVPYYA